MNWALLVIVGLLVGWFLPKRYIPSRFAALRRDPRIVASAAAVLWLAIDDRPDGTAANFDVAWSATMFSIIFGDALTIAVQRRWDRTGKCIFAAALLLKLMSLLSAKWFHIEAFNIGFLLLAHALMFIAASGGLHAEEAALQSRARILRMPAAFILIRGVLGMLAVVFALAILSPFPDYPESDRAVSEYCTLAATRAIVPYLFWTTLLAYPWILKRSARIAAPGNDSPALAWFLRTLGMLRKRYFGQGLAGFKKGGQYRRYLFYLALALPAIFLPDGSYKALTRTHFYVGWPFDDLTIHVGNCFGDGKFLHFGPSLGLLPMAALWTYLTSLGWKARTWARARPDWLGALVQATLTSLYIVLVVCLVSGAFQVIWEWWMMQQDESGIERGVIFAFLWLSNLYALGAAFVFVTLFLDARLRPRLQWFVHFAFALCFVFAFFCLSLPFFHLFPPLYPVSHQALVRELDDLEWRIGYVYRKQIEPPSDPIKKNADRLDRLEMAYAANPQLDDALWSLSRRIAKERGPGIIWAVMERSRNWSDNEGLIFVPLLTSLPRNGTLRRLKGYLNRSNVESDRFWAEEFLTDLNSADTK